MYASNPMAQLHANTLPGLPCCAAALQAHKGTKFWEERYGGQPDSWAQAVDTYSSNYYGYRWQVGVRGSELKSAHLMLLTRMPCFDLTWRQHAHPGGDIFRMLPWVFCFQEHRTCLSPPTI